MLKIVIIMLTILLFLTHSSALQKSPEEIRYLADSLRGEWTGSLSHQGAFFSLEMWGKWILGGHFFELELVARTNEYISTLERFIFGWDASHKAYRCWHFNSKGESRTSLWRRVEEKLIVEVSQPANFMKLEEARSKLLFALDGRSMVFRLKQR